MRKIALVSLLIFANLDLAAGVFKRTPEKVREEYIVTLKKERLASLEMLAGRLATQYGGRVMSLYRNAFVGFSVRMSQAQAEALAEHPLVEAVEENGIVRPSATTTVTTSEWQLDRIDEVSPAGSYKFCTTRNATPVIYLFDSGVNQMHREFLFRDDDTTRDWYTYRVFTGWNFVLDGKPFYGGAIDSTCGAFTHGTAVASVAAGLNYGVAKYARIFPVRVVSCDQTSNLAVLLNAIDYTIGEAATNQTHIANFSLFQENAPDQGALDAAINALIDRNFVVVASANNQGADRCATQSPARIPRVITVGGTTNNPMDRRVTGQPSIDGPGSNYGSCVDIFAPGYALRTATWLNFPVSVSSEVRTDTAATSYAAGIVSGLAGRYLEQNPSHSPAQVWNWLQNNATPVVVDSQSASNLLIRAIQECP